MARPPQVAALLAALVLAGCLGAPATPTPSPSATPPPTADCPYVLSVEEAGAASGDRVDYGELPPERRGEFTDALAAGSIELGGELPEAWSRPRIVSYEGTAYYVVASVC